MDVQEMLKSKLTIEKASRKIQQQKSEPIENHISEKTFRSPESELY